MHVTLQTHSQASGPQVNTTATRGGEIQPTSDMVAYILEPEVGEEYEFLKTLSFKRAQKTLKNPPKRTPI